MLELLQRRQTRTDSDNNLNYTRRPQVRAGFCLSGALFGKYVWGALPCPNTVAQLPDCVRTQSCHHRHVSIPVIPQAGKSPPPVYFETSLSAVFWNSGHWKYDHMIRLRGKFGNRCAPCGWTPLKSSERLLTETWTNSHWDEVQWNVDFTREWGVAPRFFWSSVYSTVCRLF